ncbi:hypothetical protein OsccyDRAFT_4447 [Leptolyngbyaceae cyanobacterium JSC-12]|nr:hypothetical protein OsccyDRAFT_4447 [Leptolyngbyaceae cyanobacterium JSC-12]
MLKLTYTEHGLHLERAAVPLEVLVAQRVMLAIRAGQRLHIEPGTASFLLAANTPGLAQLRRSLQLEHPPTMTIAPVDDEFVELTVYGSWLAETVEAQEGIFVTAFSHLTEMWVIKLWEATQAQVTFLA